MEEGYNRRGLFLRLVDEVLSSAGDYLRDQLSGFLSWWPSEGAGEEGQTVFPSPARSWREELVGLARLVGVREVQEPRETWLELAERLHVPAPVGGEEETLAAIAGALGVETEGASYVTLLESIGEKLGVPRAYVFDWNKYYLGADRYWTARIAEGLGLSPVRTDGEILRRVAETLGVEVAGTEGSEATLQAIARELGVSAEPEDPLRLLRLIASRLRLESR